MAAIKRPRGTRDLGPDEMRIRRAIENRMRTTLSRYAYREVQTPVFEHLELFTAKSGDAIKQELYDFKDKAGRELALRPELTAAVMRLYHNELLMEPRPLKLWYFSNCFRYDRPQKGRYREFWQVGCEIVGSDHPETHAELIALTLDLLRDAGVQETQVRIGHIAVLQGLLHAIGVPPASEHERGPLMRGIDKWDEKEIRKQLQEAGVSDEAAGRLIGLGEKAETAQLLEKTKEVLESGSGGPEDAATKKALAALKEVREALDLLATQHPDAPVRFDSMIARGLDYYTGLVFEVDAPRLGAEKQIAGGGGYDLSSVFDAERVPTTGFALGFDRVLVALDAEENLPEPDPWLDVYLAPIGDEQRTPALRLARNLREAGLRVEVDLMRRAPGKNLKAADAHKARWAVLLGEREAKAGMVTLKTLATGDQEEVPQDELTKRLTARSD
jgi:histidyl-tRNA synthetase